MNYCCDDTQPARTRNIFRTAPDAHAPEAHAQEATPQETKPPDPEPPAPPPAGPPPLVDEETPKQYVQLITQLFRVLAPFPEAFDAGVAYLDKLSASSARAARAAQPDPQPVTPG